MSRHRLFPPSRHFAMPTLLAAVTAAAAIGCSAGAGAQSAGDPTVPPLPPAAQSESTQATPPQAEPPQQATAQPTTEPQAAFPPLPLGHDGVREVQSQLIALGFDPGPADGEAGPATVAAARQYNENRGRSGPVPIDGALLARLQQDGAPRLTPEQVAARPQPRYQAQAPAANPIANVMQQFESNLRGLFGGRY